MERTRTSSLDADLRIRLEGAAEVLEQAVAQLETATRQLARSPNELVRDDVVDLKAVLAGWAAVDEAIERAQRHEEAAALVARVRQAREALGREVAKWLAMLGLPVEASAPAEQLRGLMKGLAYVGRPAGPNERALFEGEDRRPWGYFAAAQAAAAGVMAYLSPAIGLAAAAISGVGFLALTRRPSPVRWTLFPDRLQVDRPASPLIDVQYEAITAVLVDGHRVIVTTADFSLELSSLNANGLARLIRSMGESMGAASPTPGVGVVVPVSFGDRRLGTALFTPSGALVVHETDATAFVNAVLPGAERPTVQSALAMLRHLPAPVLAERLRGLPASWWPADEMLVQESANSLGHRTFVREGDPERRLTVFPTELHLSGALREVDTITAGWRRY
jgi:hypothetical protein